ncbi:Intraflagellar transport protein [Fasciola hepatica]|uniref:Intraflagellar transport protein n=1 Tax=Fasciola hepatica TaxID=6192 RepID=A0A4E0R9F2_FASHE|nr:Intraflagellar transport protein [Fasciola hepatica]
MRLKHLKTIISPQPAEARICAIAWSPNNKKLAICGVDNVITLFDEKCERRDRFAAKPLDPKTGKRGFVIKGMAFSPDSTKLAVAQSDHILFVYKLGETWDEKKAICNKFPQQSPVTCLLWPPGQPIICGLADGKVRAANAKSNKSSTIYNVESYVVSLSLNGSGKGFVSGHADGKIVRYFFEDEGTGDTQGKLATHPTAPYALTWAGSCILAGGCDRRIYVYGRDGRVTQQFDYSREDLEKEFTVAVTSPSGQSVAFGSFDRIRLFAWSPRKACWEESEPKQITHLYTITAMAWKRDGSKLTVGTWCGGVEHFDCCMKRQRYKNKFELNYVGPSQVIVRNMKTEEKVVLQSYFGYEIDEVKVMGDDRYLVAHTSDTLMLGDLRENRLSEVHWNTKGTKAEFYFGYPNFCIIFGQGELFVIEYGVNEILGSVRTEFTNPYLVSVRVNERKLASGEANKKIAYMLDGKTIAIMDMLTGTHIAQVTHDVKIDWIELNETGHKLLFRDKNLQLLLYDTETMTRSTLLSLCSYVQWVPQSDVVVAQSRDTLCIWYNIEATDRVTTVSLKGGDILDIVRQYGKTEVLVTEGLTSVSYALDNGLIEFGTAMDDGDFQRAVTFLESLPVIPETKSMWSKLAKASLKAGQLLITERCYAALGCVSKVHFLRKTREMAEIGAAGDYQVQTRIALLEKDFKTAEHILLAQNAVAEVTEMYKDLNKWESAIEIAEVKSWSGLDQLRKEHQAWLTETGQDEKAAELRQKEGDLTSAVTLYLRAGVPGKAARLAMSEPQLSNERSLMERIIQALIQNELYEKAGEMYQHMNQLENAMRCYRQGHAFQRAVELARSAFPTDVIKIEEEWGGYLVSQQQMDSAIHHFIEAGAYVKAADAAINSRQWAKAAHILASIEDTKSPEILAPHFLKLAQHHAACKEYEAAESAFLKANRANLAIEMYNNAGMWEEAHRLAAEAMDHAELTDMYLSQAEQLEASGQLKEAERLYLTVKETDRAITMYKRTRQYRDMLRLVRTYNPELLDQTHLHLAQELEKEGNLKQAEQYYLEAKDWKSAINMYRTRDQWEEAYRVSSTCTSQPEVRKQVAYLWAKHLGGDSAVRLLTRIGLLESAIDYATDHCAFEFAFDLARLACPERVKDVHNKLAMFLEDEGKFAEAEAEFVKAGKPREAVLMYVHNQDWDSAARVAADHDPDSVNDVLLGQARLAFGDKEFARAEALLLRAQRPDMAVRAYREAGMWEEALRVAEAYLPNRVQELQEEFKEERVRAASTEDSEGLRGGKLLGSGTPVGGQRKQSADSSPSELGTITNTNLLQARELESHGEYLRAVECYLKVHPDSLSSENPDHSDLAADVCQHAWLHAANLAVKFLPSDSAAKVAELVASRLVSISRHSLAGELLLSVDKIQKAVDAFIAGDEWSKARRVARELEPRLESYVETKYKEALKSSGQAETLAGVDVLSALDMYAEQGRWEKCLAAAEQLVQAATAAAGPGSGGSNARCLREHQRLHKYVAAYAASLIKDSRVYDAMLLYKKYGAPAYTQNFNIYKRIFQDITGQRTLTGPDSYPTWSALRNMLFDLHQNLTHASDIQTEVIEIFERMLLVAHYYATRSALMTSSQDLREIITKLSVSLLRHSDILPADKVFYEAGIHCREIGWLSMAFVFLNRYLDLVEAIEDPDGSADTLDASDFQGTDIPMEVPLPEEPYTTQEEHEAVRDWILTMSMDQKLDQSLPKDERGVYVAALEAPGTGLCALPCIVSGYPVLRNALEFDQPNKVAIRECWNRFQHLCKVARSTECSDVKEFIQRWCGLPHGGSNPMNM